MKVTHPKTSSIVDRRWRRSQEPGLDTLIKDVQANGVTTPIILSPQGDVVDGQRRLDAARATRLAVIPATQATDWTHLADLVLQAAANVDADQVPYSRLDQYHLVTDLRKAQTRRTNQHQEPGLPSAEHSRVPAWMGYLAKNAPPGYPGWNVSFFRVMADIESAYRLLYASGERDLAWGDETLALLDDPAVGVHSIRTRIRRGPKVEREPSARQSAVHIRAISEQLPALTGTVRGLGAVIRVLDPGVCGTDLLDLERALTLANTLRADIHAVFRERNYVRVYPEV